MKQIIVLVLFSCLLYSSWCRSFKKSKQQPIALPESLETYPQEILTEMNQYLVQYSFPELKWNDQLKETTSLAAQEIVASNTFGQHSNLEQWQAKVPNDIFSEINFIVNVTNSNYYSKSLSSKSQKIMYDTKMSVGTIMKTIQAPSAAMFAKNIIEALESEHLLLTLNQYSDCGISLVALDQAKFPNEYLTVIHLIKGKGGSATENKVIYTSCKDALAKGNKETDLTITVNGKESQVQCDQTTEGGGWTKVFKNAGDFTQNTTQAIDDLSLDYAEILFQSQPGHYQNFAPSGWKSEGYNIALNVLRFGEIWWASDQTPYTRTPFEAMTNKQKFVFNTDFKGLVKSGVCYFNNVNHTGYCYSSFILKKLGGARLNAISDYNSVLNQGSIMSSHYDCAIYVR